MNMNLETPLKFLGKDYCGRFSGYDYTPHLPTRQEDGTSRPGQWLAVKGRLAKCQNGIHFCTLAQVARWADDRCYIAEAAGKVVHDEEKSWCRKLRLLAPLEAWNERTLRLWACDCAERVLPLANDRRCTEAITVARRYANGEATKQELHAAGAAATAAAGAAATATATATGWAAARDLAWAAAWAATGATARAAAGAAAWAAARDAATAATGATARAAAWAAAWAAEMAWQNQRLRAYLLGEPLRPVEPLTLLSGRT